MRQNLALVLALQGKLAEAEELAKQDLPPKEVAENLRYWKQAVKEQRSKSAAAPAKAAPAAPPAALNTADLGELRGN